MRRTEEPLASKRQEDLFTRLSELAGIASAVIAVAALLSNDAQLRSWIALAFGALLVLLGTVELARSRCRNKRKGDQGSSREGYGRLCLSLGVLQFLIALAWPSAAAFTGVVVAASLIWLGLRGPAGRKDRRRRARPARLALLAIGFVLIGYGGLAGAVIGDHSDSPPGPEDNVIPEGPPAGSPEADPPQSEIDEPPSYADLCEVLPNPLVIGHGLGELFQRDGAIKAGCGTLAFEVPETGTWVAAGMCFGERRSVAVASPNRTPAILYGEAAEFVWDAAQEEELATVEAAEPEGGDVILVETGEGTYGFARATRSATPGNDDAQQCNEVGGTAEPFARMPPPLVWLWADLVRRQASWFWPTADRAGELESVAFLSAEGVARGTCATDTACSLEFEDEEKVLENATFVKLEDLREFMPAEETSASSA